MAVSFGPKAGVHAGTRTICAIFLVPFLFLLRLILGISHIPARKSSSWSSPLRKCSCTPSCLSMRRTILFARQLGRNRPFYCRATGESLIYFQSSASDKERRSDRVAYCHAFGRP